MLWHKQRQIDAARPCSFVVRTREMEKTFGFDGYTAVVELRHGSACLYVRGEDGTNLCVVPLAGSRELQGRTVTLYTARPGVLGVQLDGAPAVMVDTGRRRVMSRLGGAFGSDAWGPNVYCVWDRGLAQSLFGA